MRQHVKKTLGQVLVVVALASGVVLLAVTTGLLPQAQPESIETVPLVIQKSQTNAKKPANKAPAVPHARVFPLCSAPEEDGRLQVASNAQGALSLFVWCRGGYGLFTFAGAATAQLVTQLAHLPSDMPRAGGATLADITADGVADLMVGVAPKEGLLHASGSGVFLAKGRAQGGYEAALPLLEMPIVALTTALNAGGTHDLFVLTRGDAAARRPGQIVWFGAGATPLKKATFNTGISPRELRASQPQGGARSLLVLAGEPARVIAVSPDKDPAQNAREVALPEGAGLCRAQDPSLVLARTTHDLLRVNDDATLGLSPWFPQANVGPCASGDLDRDGTPDALAVTDAGVIWLRPQNGDAAAADAAQELTLPAGYRALDVAYVPGESARVMALAREVASEQLVLLVWYALPWVDGATVVLDMEPARESGGVAEIPLE